MTERYFLSNSMHEIESEYIFEENKLIKYSNILYYNNNKIYVKNLLDKWKKVTTNIDIETHIGCFKSTSSVPLNIDNPKDINNYINECLLKSNKEKLYSEIEDKKFKKYDDRYFYYISKISDPPIYIYTPHPYILIQDEDGNTTGNFTNKKIKYEKVDDSIHMNNESYKFMMENFSFFDKELSYDILNKAVQDKNYEGIVKITKNFLFDEAGKMQEQKDSIYVKSEFKYLFYKINNEILCYKKKTNNENWYEYDRKIPDGKMPMKKLIERNNLFVIYDIIPEISDMTNNIIDNLVYIYCNYNCEEVKANISRITYKNFKEKTSHIWNKTYVNFIVGGESYINENIKKNETAYDLIVYGDTGVSWLDDVEKYLNIQNTTGIIAMDYKVVGYYRKIELPFNCPIRDWPDIKKSIPTTIGFNFNDKYMDTGIYCSDSITATYVIKDSHLFEMTQTIGENLYYLYKRKTCSDNLFNKNNVLNAVKGCKNEKTILYLLAVIYEIIPLDCMNLFENEKKVNGLKVLDAAGKYDNDQYIVSIGEIKDQNMKQIYKEQSVYVYEITYPLFKVEKNKLYKYDKYNKYDLYKEFGINDREQFYDSKILVKKRFFKDNNLFPNDESIKKYIIKLENNDILKYINKFNYMDKSILEFFEVNDVNVNDWNNYKTKFIIENKKITYIDKDKIIFKKLDDKNFENLIKANPKNYFDLLDWNKTKILLKNNNILSEDMEYKYVLYTSKFDYIINNDFTKLWKFLCDIKSDYIYIQMEVDKKSIDTDLFINKFIGKFKTNGLQINNKKLYIICSILNGDMGDTKLNNINYLLDNNITSNLDIVLSILKIGSEFITLISNSIFEHGTKCYIRNIDNINSFKHCIQMCINLTTGIVSEDNYSINISDNIYVVPSICIMKSRSDTDDLIVVNKKLYKKIKDEYYIEIWSKYTYQIKDIEKIHIPLNKDRNDIIKFIIAAYEYINRKKNNTYLGYLFEKNYKDYKLYKNLIPESKSFSLNLPINLKIENNSILMEMSEKSNIIYTDKISDKIITEYLSNLLFLFKIFEIKKADGNEKSIISYYLAKQTLDKNPNRNNLITYINNINSLIPKNLAFEIYDNVDNFIKDIKSEDDEKNIIIKKKKDEIKFDNSGSYNTINEFCEMTFFKYKYKK